VQEKREEKPIHDQASTTPIAASDEQTRATSVAITMYCVLLVAYSLMAADRYLFPVLAPDIRRAFGFSLTNTGLLSTIFTLGLAIGGLPTGYLLSHFSRKTVMMVGIAIFSGGIGMTTQAIGFWTMLVCLAASGIGMAMLATSMFALAASYFYRYRAAAIGSVNLCYGLGGFYGPRLASLLLVTYGTWRAAMLGFSFFGFVMIGLIAVSVRAWFSETHRAVQARANHGGAQTLLNRNTILLTMLSVVEGIAMYGYLGMYPTFLREALHFSPKMAGSVMSFFGVGALLSIFGGWIGDRFSPRFVLAGGFLGTAVLGYLFFHGSDSIVAAEIMTFAFGVCASTILYVNLAGYHVKAVRSNLASRGSGMFVTSLYASSAVAGYLMGALVDHAGGVAARGAWMVAGNIQIVGFSILGAALAFALQPKEMAL
jgi:predicted MFS family arabinose efflux permease